MSIPGVTPTGLGYDGQGRLTSLTQGTRTWSFGWDAKFRLTSVEDPLQRTVSFSYDDADRVVSQTLPDGRVIGFAYDANGNVTAVTPPGRPDHTFAYTAVDLEDTYDPPDVAGISPNTTRYVYNLDRNLTQVQRPDGQTIDLGYDTGGRLSSITTDGRTLGFAYDSGGNLKMLSDSDGPSLSYSWDGFLPTQVSWAGEVGGTIAWRWDNDFKVTSESVNGAPVSFSYDNDNLLTSAGSMTIARDAMNGRITGTTLGGVTDNYQYDSFGQLSVYSASYNGSEVFRVEYTRDDIGRIAEKRETRYGATFTESYGYDLMGRLETVTRNGSLVSTFTYDANGNRLSHATPTTTTMGSYDDQDRLLTYGDATYDYTANGELLTKTDSRGMTTYDYDTLGNLRRVGLPNGTVIDYVIDAQNRRVGKKISGVLERAWLYGDQLNPIAELDGSGAVLSRFVYGVRLNVPDYMIKGGVTYRIISDHLGSVRYVLDTSTGTIVQSMDYDEFGNVMSDSNPGFQPLGFAGGLWDRSTSLLRLGARDYDPLIGRWSAKDPIRFGGSGVNFYAYVQGDPVNYADITGLVQGPVSAVTGGTVFRIGWQTPSDHNQGLGYRISIRRPDGTYDQYGHLDPNSVAVNVGDTVSLGDYLGMYADPTNGSSTGPHVHHERRESTGAMTNPGDSCPIPDPPGGRRTSSYQDHDAVHPSGHQGNDWVVNRPVERVRIGRYVFILADD